METKMKKRIILSLLTVSSLYADAQMDAIKEQLEEQKEAMASLNAKLVQLEQKSTNNSASFSQNAYLPDMAFILNMSVVGRNVNNDDYTAFEIPGFINSPDTPDLPFNANRGFNFNYAEVALHSVVDPYFEAFAIFHISPEELEIEEAYVQTTSLPYSLKVKAGKFKSNFGRLNEQHHHVWNFDSQPLIYKGLFGPDGISDAGIQLQWVAPTDTYLMIGSEAMQGSNERSFGDTSKNNLYIGYVKSSVDIGDDLSILAGVSYAHGKNITTNATDVYGADLTLREQLGSYSALIWQSEYLDRNMKQTDTRTDKQAGLYSELNYQYNNNYSFGVMYDLISKNDTDLSAYAGVDTDNLDRYTAKMDYKPFPMSRLRLSATYDRSKVIAGERKNITEVMLSLNIAAGAHGAHNY
jgi:hypothetical protein